MSRKARRKPTPPRVIARLLAIVQIGETSIVIRDDGRAKRSVLVAALVELQTCPERSRREGIVK